jgi:hypothetical protein
VACRRIEWAALFAVLATAALASCGPATSAAPPFTRPVPDQLVTVTCPNLGSLSVALPSGKVDPPVPELQVSVGYQATVRRTHQTVTAGQPPGEILCATIPFPERLAPDVSPGTLPAGIRPDDWLAGNWIVSVTVRVP